MIYIVINGLLVEAESWTAVHAHVEVRRTPRAYPKENRKIPKENDTLTEIVREVLNQIKKNPSSY